MKSFPALVLLVVLFRESTAASTMITSEADGSINCDGLKCPLGENIRCVVTADTINGLSTVNRQCVNAAGAVILESAYNVESPGLTFGRQTSTAIFYS